MFYFEIQIHSFIREPLFILLWWLWLATLPSDSSSLHVCRSYSQKCLKLKHTYTLPQLPNWLSGSLTRKNYTKGMLWFVGWRFSSVMWSGWGLGWINEEHRNCPSLYLVYWYRKPQIIHDGYELSGIIRHQDAFLKKLSVIWYNKSVIVFCHSVAQKRISVKCVKLIWVLTLISELWLFFLKNYGFKLRFLALNSEFDLKLRILTFWLSEFSNSYFSVRILTFFRICSFFGFYQNWLYWPNTWTHTRNLFLVCFIEQ